MLQTIRQRLSQNHEEDQKSLIILQQLSLMFSILNQLSQLKQSLSHERDQRGNRTRLHYNLGDFGTIYSLNCC